MTEQHIDPATPLDRLDMMLVASGLVESRAKAQRLIKAGHVRVDGETITKPSFMVKAGHSELAVDKGDDYVSEALTNSWARSKPLPAMALPGRKAWNVWISVPPPVASPTYCCAGERPKS